MILRRLSDGNGSRFRNLLVGVFGSLVVLQILWLISSGFLLTQPTKTYPSEIDVVYTYVNGSETNQFAALRFWMERLQPEKRIDSPSLSSRFRDNGELRYSFRSLDMYMPWVRKVYLVVASPRQVPHFVDRRHPRVQVVYHHTLFDHNSLSDALPTFNSRAIETQLHKIHGLSENYIYMNDDLFIGQELSFEDFAHYEPGAEVNPNDASPDPPALRHLVFLEHTHLAPSGCRYQWEVKDTQRGARSYANALIDQHHVDTQRKEFWSRPRPVLRHTPRLFNKRLVEGLYNVTRFALALNETAMNRFRTVRDVELAFLYTHYYLEMDDSPLLDPGVSESKLASRYLKLKTSWWKTWKNIFKFKLDAWYNSWKFLCTNDVMNGDPPSDTLLLIERFYATLFPSPASFELLSGSTADPTSQHNNARHVTP